MITRVKKLFALPFLVGTLVVSAFVGDVLADDTKYEIYGKDGEFIYPDNTECSILDKSKRVVAKENSHITFYEMCLGSFPKYASTKVEEGMQPIYYAKYYFYPNPTPVYNVTSDGLTDSLGQKTGKKTYSNKIVDGLAFKVQPDLNYEGLDDPSFQGIYYLYPNDETHFTDANRQTSFIRGPYQIGYNSYYHNAYRSRMMAQSVDFNFEIYEPKTGENMNSDNANTKLLFEGKIVYELSETCFDTKYLVYSESCTEIEFYFPKGKVIDKSKDKTDFATANEGVLTNIMENEAENAYGSEKNTVPVDRVYYRNPGVHNIKLQATENLKLRLQQDIGTEYQTRGNTNSTQGVNAIDDKVYYFDRIETDIFGQSIVPKRNIVRVVSEVYRDGMVENPDGEMNEHNGKLAFPASSIDATANYDITKIKQDVVGTHYEYEPRTDFINYCTLETNANGTVSDSKVKYEGTSYLLSLEEQKHSNCYHNNNRTNHFWQYSWSETNWYN